MTSLRSIFKRITPAILVCVLMTVSMLSLVASTLATHGENLEKIYYQDGNDISPLENIGMDMYNSMLFAEFGDYTTSNTLYPPMNFIFFGLLAKSIPDLQDRTPMEYNQDHSLLSSQEAIMTYVYLSITYVVLLAVVLSLLSSMRGAKAILFIAVVLASGPVLFLLERGNGLIFSVFLTGCFLCWYRSPNRMLSELALILLAIGAALKIYPALFGLLLLREKRWKQALHALLYGILFFLLPFAFMGGWPALWSYISVGLKTSVSDLSVYKMTGGAYRIDLSNITQVVVRLLHIRGANTTRRLILAALLIMPFFSRVNWRAVLAVTALSVLAPAFSGYYTACFYLLALALFLKESERRPIDYFYAIAFSLVFCALPYGPNTFIPGEYINANSINMTVSACCLGEIMLLVLLGIDFLKDLIRFSNRNKIRPNTSIRNEG